MAGKRRRECETTNGNATQNRKPLKKLTQNQPDMPEDDHHTTKTARGLTQPPSSNGVVVVATRWER